MIGAAVSPDPKVSRIGAALLESGANAIEAGVAMGAALAVTRPHFCGLGGDAVWVISDAAGHAQVILGIGRAAADLSRVQRIATRGPGSALTSAGAVDSWGKALAHAAEYWGGHRGGRWGGHLPLDALLEPAIGLAVEGTAPSASLVWWRDFRRSEAAQWPHFALPEPGTDGLLRQPDLGRSLRMIARDGIRSFYEGALARTISEGLRATNCPLTRDDLAATRAASEAPLATRFADALLLAPPPPTQGATTLKIMGLLDRLDLTGQLPESAAFFHLVIEAVKQAFLTRGEIADIPGARLTAMRSLDDGSLAAAAACVDTNRALPWPQPFRQADTVFFDAVDRRGNCASVLQSIYYDWGAAVTVPETGIIWHNRGAAFAHDRHHPNGIAPGKRPFLTLNPGIALRDGRAGLLYGTQGADGQPQTLALLLSRILGYGIGIDEALDRPRFLLGRTFSDDRRSLKLEDHVGQDVPEALRRLGHEVSLIPARSPLAGEAGLIGIEPGAGVTGGGHDPRGEGTLSLVPEPRP